MNMRLLPNLMLALLVGPALADGDLTSMSLEDLSRMEVTTVSRKVQRLADTSAAVSVVTAEDIARMGARSIPEALRHVPGVYAAQIAPGQWALSIRGFNGRFSNKLLVQIDGRTIYTPFFAGVFWEAQQLMMEDIERIEVVRGPGASLWGANAVNGVVNIVTRRASATVGTLAWLEADDDGRVQAGARYGFADDRDFAARVYARSIGLGEFDDQAGDGLGNAQHGWQAGFRADLGTGANAGWSLQGGSYILRAPEQLEFPGVALGFGVDAALGFEYKGGHLMLTGHWPTDAGEAELRTYIDHFEVGVAGAAGGDIDTVDADFQHRLDPLGRHEVIWGLGARYTAFEFDPAAPVLTFTRDDGREHIISAFFQDEISLQPRRWKLTLGTRVENNSLSGGTEWQPNIRLLWTPSDRDSIWAHVSRASRTPSLGEQYAKIVAGLAPLPQQPPQCVQFQLTCSSVIISRTALDRDLEAEHLTAFELGYRRQIGAGSVEAVAYRHQFKDLFANTLGATAVPGSLPFPIVADQYIDRRNGGKAHVVGLETSFEMPIDTAMRLFGAYAIQNLDESAGDPALQTTSAYEAVLPHQMASLRASFDIAESHELDLMWRHVGALGDSRFGTTIPSYQASDLNYRWRVTREFELALYIQNLFDQGHAEFAPDFFPAPLGYAPRRAFLKGIARF